MWNKKHGASRGFTLIEAAIVMVVFAIVAALVAAIVLGNMRRAQRARAHGGGPSLVTAVAGAHGP